MPYVHIDWVKGPDQKQRDEVARRVNAAVSDVTGIPAEMIWVVFSEIEADSWYVADKSVKQMRDGGTG